MTPDQEKALRAELEELKRSRDNWRAIVHEDTPVVNEVASLRTALAAAQGVIDAALAYRATYVVAGPADHEKVQHAERKLIWAARRASTLAALKMDHELVETRGKLRAAEGERDILRKAYAEDTEALRASARNNLDNERKQIEGEKEQWRIAIRADRARVIEAEDAKVRAEALIAVGEGAYMGSVVAGEVIAFLTAAGCGKPGKPNTVWAMTQEIIARATAAEGALREARAYIVTLVGTPPPDSPAGQHIAAIDALLKGNRTPQAPSIP